MGGLPLDQVNDEQSPAPSPGLDALAAQAAAIEGAAAPAAAPGQAVDAPKLSTADELLSALTMARMIVSPGFGWWPEFGQVWGDGTLRGIADAGAEVMQRHGVTMGEMWSQWGPYIALAGATLPPSLVTYQAITERKAEREREQRAPARVSPAPADAAP